MAEEELNRFLQSKRILSVQRHFSDTDEPAWHICVEYLDITDSNSTASNTWNKNNNKIDYKEKLSDTEFSRFSLMRECRKAIAQDEAIPAYAVFLDEHLAELSKHETLSPAILKSISGIGEKKYQKYGERFIALYNNKNHETSSEDVFIDSADGQPSAGVLESAAGEKPQD